jgi:hypothetical protein
VCHSVCTFEMYQAHIMELEAKLETLKEENRRLKAEEVVNRMSFQF